MDHTIRIGGEAGQGLQVIGSVLAKLFSRYGLHVFTHQDYMSRIRGGHNYYQIRFADNPVISSRDKIDILLALDLNTISIHQQTMSEKGIILYDAESVKQKFSGTQFINVPFADITKELGIDIIMTNSVAVGAVLGILNFGLDLFEETIADFLHGKGAAVIATNRDAAQAGFDFMHKEHKVLKHFKVTVGQRQGLMLINGSEAIGLGALLSGCKFYAAYPMTPSTGIMNYLASKAAEYNIVVEQAEDEIGAINMALGASYGGVRAMTGTSGGGFALMTEGVSLAGMTETPVVIAEVQRPGPATGLPTRTEQGDLLFVLHGGHGEFPRVVFTPGTPEQAFYLSNKAFHLAEKYQIPVFILSDQYLADSEWTYVELNTDRLLYEDFRLRKENLDDLQSYHRYEITQNGVSPMAVPGESIHTVVVDSDEHDEQGHIIEDAQTRIRMVEKRFHKKMPLIRQEIEPPVYYGADQPETLLVGFGSTYGVLKGAVDSLSDQYRIGMLHFSEIFPFPLPEKSDFLDLLKQASLTICIENNASSQFARLMLAETGFAFKKNINKYDGRPFTLDTLVGDINGYLRGL
jgi:2-oxoglutarate ferredoxin oxidoreductase subunit alpha